MIVTIDGNDNATYRKKEMNWLADSNTNPNECRMLCNARCLSEGVDVPALDGVVFADPRQSVVDVVQSVGRVMRKHPGKKNGYVILPVAIPSGMREEEILEQEGPFKVVWQVLRALQSHDKEFTREIAQLNLTDPTPSKQITERVSVIIPKLHGSSMLDNIVIGIKTRLAKFETYYYDKYAEKLGETAEKIEFRIFEEIKTNSRKKTIIQNLNSDLKELINDSVSEQDSVRTVAQHIILSRIFDELFSGNFTTRNPMSKILNTVIQKFDTKHEITILEEMGFYQDISKEIAHITNMEGSQLYSARQTFIKTIYGNFFNSAAKKDAQKHGIVYTPVEIVDFLIHSIQNILKSEFKLDFSCRQVKVLDPFAGTGMFISRLLESGLLGTGQKFYEKYKSDLQTNEIILLAYYIATINIETTYSNLRKSNKYVPFEGINYVDTFRLDPQYRKIDRVRQTKIVSEELQEAVGRIEKQKGSHIHVVIGNPPYSVGQKNSNENNPNLKYNFLDKRIKDTYFTKANATLKKSLYDSYIRSIRWASDRIGESGVIGFVTNGSFVKSEVGAGVRACLNEEFTDIWVFDLRGNQNTQGETSKNEGGKIFGSGSKAPVILVILVKNPKKKKHEIHYKDIGDKLTREKKLNIIKESSSINYVSGWKLINPDKHNDWLEHRDSNFDKYVLMGKKSSKNKQLSIFQIYSAGIKTNRDIWSYNSSKEKLARNIKRHIDYCNKQDPSHPIIDPTQAKWTGELTERLQKLKTDLPTFNINNIRAALYRPFFKQFLYFDKIHINSVYRIPSFFPNKNSVNLVICVPYKFTGKFSTFITNITPDVQVMKNGQCFPFYIYKNGKRLDNITDFMLKQYSNHYKNDQITKTDIFYYVYGILHHPQYKKKYANNLSKDLPRIPFAKDFKGFSDIGRSLAELHLSFETCKKYDLGKPCYSPSKYEKLNFGRKSTINTKGSEADKTIIRIDGITVFENVPECEYAVNGRTPIEWVVDRCVRTVDEPSKGKLTKLKESGKASTHSGIVNDSTVSNILDVIRRAVYIGQESDRLIAKLPKEFEDENWDPGKTGLDAYPVQK